MGQLARMGVSGEADSDSSLCLSAHCWRVVDARHAGSLRSDQCDSDADNWAALRQRLDGDPAARAAALALVRQHAPQLLRDGDGAARRTVTATKAAPDLPSEADPIRVARTRDQALVTGTIAIVLSFLPPRERLWAGGVSHAWRIGQQQPSAWRSAAVRFAPLICRDCGFSEEHEECHPRQLELPGWLAHRMERLSSDASAVRYPRPLARLCPFSGLCHLQLLPFGAEFMQTVSYQIPQPTVSAAAVDEALRPLRLQSLELVEMDPACEGPLWQALFGLPSAGSAAGSSSSASAPAPMPIINQWSCTLVHFALGWIPLSLSSTDPLLDSLAQLRFPALQSLALQLHDRAVRISTRGRSCDTAALRRWLNPGCLPQLQSLRVSLDSQHRLPRSCLTAALLAVLPQIDTLTELDVGFPLGLVDEQPDGWLPGLHLLPSLRVLRCNVDMTLATSATFATSIAMAPSLEVLQLCASPARLVCERLRRRCEATSVGVGGSVTGPVVALRELHVSDQQYDPDAQGAVLVDLAALPLLERLQIDSRVFRVNLPLLESLRQILFLRLAVISDEDARALGALQLPRLRTLALSDTNFDPLSVERGLRFLLQLPSLTRLEAPLLPVDSLAYLRLLARDRSDGRPALEIVDHADWSTHRDSLWADSFAVPAAPEG